MPPRDERRRTRPCFQDTRSGREQQSQKQDQKRRHEGGEGTNNQKQQQQKTRFSHLSVAVAPPAPEVVVPGTEPRVVPAPERDHVLVAGLVERLERLHAVRLAVGARDDQLGRLIRDLLLDLRDELVVGELAQELLARGGVVLVLGGVDGDVDAAADLAGLVELVLGADVEVGVASLGEEDLLEGEEEGFFLLLVEEVAKGKKGVSLRRRWSFFFFFFWLDFLGRCLTLNFDLVFFGNDLPACILQKLTLASSTLAIMACAVF